MRVDVDIFGDKALVETARGEWKSGGGYYMFEDSLLCRYEDKEKT